MPNTPHTFLCTKERFSDFELVFEAKIDEGLNSRVQTRGNVQGQDLVFGPQVDIEVSPSYSGYIFGEGTGRGWISRDYSKRNVFRNGQWNEFRVVAGGTNIETWVNDQPVADVIDRLSSHEGFIALQVHSVDKRCEPLYVRWRNIRIRELR